MVTEAGSYLSLVDSCITQLKAQGPSRTCNESKEEEEDLDERERAKVGGVDVLVLWHYHVSGVCGLVFSV